MTVQEVPAPIHPIAAMGGGRGDLSGIVIEKYNIRIVHIQSEEFKELLKNHSNGEEWTKKYEEIKNDANEHCSSGHDIDHDEWQMLIPINPKEAIEDHIFDHLVLAITVAFPSDAYLRSVYHLQYVNNELYTGGTSSWEKVYRFNSVKIEQDQFRIEGIDVDELNRFITQFMDYLSKKTELSRAIQFYQSSYQINDDLMSFLALMIAMEVIVPGKEQLAFRFRRSLAILIGRDRVEAERIMKNANILYGYRSSIVHASRIKGTEETFELYYRYARNLAARMIIETLEHGFKNIQELDNEANLSGPGDFTIREGYRNFFGGNESWGAFYAHELPKLK
jgi:hypothetical protein